jgi:hypothetical protein
MSGGQNEITTEITTITTRGGHLGPGEYEDNHRGYLSPGDSKRKLLMNPRLKFRKTPMCELLGDKPARHFTHRRGKWMFVSTEAPEDFDEYHFKIARFFASPAATVDWLAHLSEKSWFDAQDFACMMRRFRSATDSYFAL